MAVSLGDIQLPNKAMNCIKKCKIIAILFTIPTFLVAKEVDKIEFQTVATPVELNLNSPEKVYSMLFALQVTNLNDAAILINSHCMVKPILKKENGEKLQIFVGSDRYIHPEPADFQYLKPKHSFYLPISASITIAKDKLTIYGISRSGTYWRYENISKGKYYLSLNYNTKDENGVKGFDNFWRGEVTTDPIEIIFK